MVVHACNLSTWEVEAGASVFKASLGYVARPCLKKKRKEGREREREREREKSG
jgi:hypothetical protein